MFDRFSSTIVDSKLYYDHFIKPALDFKDHLDYIRSSVSDAFMQDFQLFLKKFTPTKNEKPKS